jgi:hypothetical protein
VHISRSILPACLFLLSLSIQLPISHAEQVKAPKGDVYLGYSRTGNDTFYSNVGGLTGWEGTLHLKIHRPFLGIEGDVARYGIGANSTIPRTTTYMAGPLVTVKVLGPKVFAHALAGLEHSANSCGPTPISADALVYALGGGLDVPFFPFFSWRVAGDYLKAPSLSPRGVSPSTPARFSTGLVFRF